MRVTIVGLGLIGGSIARALQAAGGAPEWVVSGWSPSPGTRRAARDAGVIDGEVSLEAGVAESDIVVLAAPALACLDLVDRMASLVGARPASPPTLTDVASTKAAIVARADDRRLAFVGGHPMAGSESSGFGSSSADLFADRPWALVRGAFARDADVARAAALAEACGARPLPIDAATHDRAVAAISHLPLVLSAALVEAVCGRAGEPSPPDWPLAATLAAGAWRDMTRVARGDAAMGGGIAATNAAPIAERLRRFRDVLDEWLAALSPEGRDIDASALERRFAAAAARLVVGSGEAATPGSMP